ncbi:MAG: alpha/beta fold hydrolase [Ktedonobacteraceae bacterium]
MRCSDSKSMCTRAGLSFSARPGRIDRCAAGAGFAWLPEDDFVHHFAADVDPVKAKVMYAVQQPLAWTALQEVMGVPAWKALPSWFLVAEGDQTIPPDAERLFAQRMGATTAEVSTNHVAMVSHPDDVVQLIETATQAVSVTN